ncbi:FeoB-associated Cys-rich membrane protein [uncultured Trichococcus sp.]|uniref:FeoB-associated Cys-rich membrane protein n=1 Tax=uncultured Trichococcus sp. TaxID=189665 RepID=UPI002A18A744|nr:FeoB-associated Cys-rich membrane protein [uncultured Trichococcus sp.]
MFGDVVVFLIIAAFVAGSIAKIVRDKKKGSKCSGCPLNKTCAYRNPDADQCPMRQATDPHKEEKG